MGLWINNAVDDGESMSVKFFGAAFATMMLMAIADSIFNQSTAGFSNLNTVLSMDLVTWEEFVIVKIPVPKFDWFNALYALLSFNFFFLAGDWGGQYIRLIGVVWITASFAWAFFINVLPVLLRLVEATAATLRALNPFG